MILLSFKIVKLLSLGVVQIYIMNLRVVERTFKVSLVGIILVELKEDCLNLVVVYKVGFH